jgi:hypothetical protein
MHDYAKIRDRCEACSEISRAFVDEFLVYYAGERDGLGKKIAHQLVNYRRVITEMPREWPGMLVSQLIAYRLFMKNGLADKYAQHSEVKRRSPEELDYLQFQIEHPWRFCFCYIEKEVSPDFFEMKDALSNETFLLFSPGASQTMEELGGFPSLWLFLVGFNGKCWQTYGTLAYFKGIQPFDLFFFAKQISPEIVFVNQVQDVMDANPLPFLMTWIGGNLPITFHKKDMVVFHKSEFHVDDFNPLDFSEEFLLENKHPISMLSLKRWHGFPHFAKCFFHAKQHRLTLTAMTSRGYDNLVAGLSKHGNQFPVEPEIRATPAMLFAAREVLNVDIDMNPYEKHFAKQPSKPNAEQLKKINAFLRDLTDKLNSKKEYNIVELASKAGIDLDDAERIAEHLIRKISEMPRSL